MSRSPETRPSLLVRLKDREDQEAWHEFAEIYQPVVYRLARLKGLQHADAEDLTQLVLMAVAKAVERWEHNPRRARFRTWLHRVAHNAILNALTRGKPDRGSGDTGLLALLDKQPDDQGPDSDLLRLEYRRASDPRRVSTFHLGCILAIGGRGPKRGGGRAKTWQDARHHLRRPQSRHTADERESRRNGREGLTTAELQSSLLVIQAPRPR